MVCAMSTAAATTDATPSARLRIARSVHAQIRYAGYTPTSMARAIGMSQSKMSRRITADEPFDIDELEGIAREIEIDIIDLVAGKLPQIPGGGSRFLGVSPLRRGWKTVGPEELESPTSSV